MQHQNLRRISIPTHICMLKVMRCGDQIPTNETVRRRFIIQQQVWLFLHTQPPPQLAIYLFMVNFSLVPFIALGSTSSRVGWISFNIVFEIISVANQPLKKIISLLSTWLKASFFQNVLHVCINGRILFYSSLHLAT